MDAIYEAYEGKEPYIFISYSHMDSKVVVPLIRGLQERGFRVWYDSGIELGSEYPAYIAEHVKNCGCFIPFLTENYKRSDFCRQEINYALNKKRVILPVYLEEVELDDGLDMRLSPIQALKVVGKLDPEQMLKELTESVKLRPCRGNARPAPVIEKEDSTPKERFRKYRLPLLAGICAVLVIVLVIALSGGGGGEKTDDTPVISTEPAQTAAAPEEMPAEETVAVIPVTEDLIAENTLMINTVEDWDKEPEDIAFNTGAKRSEVGTVTFLDTLADAPEDAADASALQNGKVKAWTVKNGELYDLFIAADGGVWANADARGLFACMENATSITFGDAFHTDNALSMMAMFHRCRSLKTVDAEHLVTDSVTDMGYMFSQCSALTELDLSSFTTGAVKNMERMFYNCKKLQSLVVSSFSTVNVENMAAMFGCCESLTELNVSGFRTAAVMDMSRMFTDCYNLENIEFGDFSTVSVKSMYCMFSECTKLQELDLSGFRTGNVEDMGWIFNGCENLSKVNLTGFDTANVKLMNNMFYNCASLTEILRDDWNTSAVTNMAAMFSGCKNLKEIRVDDFDTSAVTAMEYMFYDCISVEELLVDSWDVSAVTNMDNLFRHCTNLKKLDVSRWDTGNVEIMYAMFYDCGARVDPRNFDTAKVTKYDFFMNEGKQVGGQPWENLFS